MLRAVQQRRPAARNTLDSARIPRASKLLICGLFQKGRVLAQDGERMVSFYSFPEPHWQHLRTSNVVGSPFATPRLRTDAAKRFKKVESATAAIFKLRRAVPSSNGPLQLCVGACTTVV